MLDEFKAMDTKDTKVCLRLGEERKRLYLNQNKVATHCEVTAKSVGRWEKDTPIPANKLALMAQLGYDITYILTGERCAPQAVGLDTTSENCNIAHGDKTLQVSKTVSKEQEAWLNMLEVLTGGDNERLKLIGLALIGYSQAKTENPD